MTSEQLVSDPPDEGAGVRPPRPAGSPGMGVLFSLASFLTAALLFIVQPLVGRMVLPAFGGSPQVWTTSMLFFQVSLLVGYGYTHLTTTRLPRRTQPWIHLGLLALPVLLLPIALTVAPSGRGGISPSLELLAAMAVGVAAPFVMVATSGPLIQRWFSWTDHPRAHDPYFLYAAGNIGSIAGLLAYPFLLEPLLTLDEQARLWTAGYLLAGVLLVGCVVHVRLRPASAGRGAVPVHVKVERGAPVGRRRAARWLLLAFVPSSMMIGVTSYISTDIAAVPMLWVIPLALYLLTFVVAFSSLGPIATRAATWLLPPVVVAALVVRPAGYGPVVAVLVQLALVAVVGQMAHGRLSADRPPTSQLTRFYLLLSIGGALGGLFNGIVAPLAFPTVLEHGLVAATALFVIVEWRSPLAGAEQWPAPRRLLVAAMLGLVPVLAIRAPEFAEQRAWLPAGLLLFVLLVPLLGRLGRSGVVGVTVALLALVPTADRLLNTELVERTFFGVHEVVSSGDLVELNHGTTLHGWQDISSSEARREPQNYYHRDGPVADLVAVAGGRGDLGVLGLGTGTMAAYAAPGQHVVFHEIDPAVVAIARERFTFLADSPGEIDVVLGDGRLTLAEVSNRYGLLMMDAFTSDAVPVHLLTVEAMATYLDAVTDDGIVAIHVSNRYLDLPPVVAGAVHELGASALIRHWDGSSRRGRSTTYVAVARDEASIAELRGHGWQDLPDRAVPWTDQRSDLISVLGD